MRPGMKWPRSLLACFAVASLFSSSVRVNPILILASRPRMRLGKLRRRRCAKLHGHLRAAPHLGPSLRTLFNSKIASNQQRLQPKVQAHLGDLAHRLPRKIRHSDVAALVGSHGHFGSVRLNFGLCLVRRRGRRIGLPGEIRRGEILQGRGFPGHLALVCRQMAGDAAALEDFSPTDFSGQPDAPPAASNQAEAEVKSHTPEVTMAADEGGDITVPDFSGKTMREVTEMCLHLGLEPLLVGSNLAVEHRPEAGTQVRRGAKVTVQFGTPPPAKLAKAHARSRR